MTSIWGYLAPTGRLVNWQGAAVGTWQTVPGTTRVLVQTALGTFAGYAGGAAGNLFRGQKIKE